MEHCYPRPAAAAPPPGTRPCSAATARWRPPAGTATCRWPSTSSPPAGTRSRPISSSGSRRAGWPAATTPPPSPTRCDSPRWPWPWPPTSIQPKKDEGSQGHQEGQGAEEGQAKDKKEPEPKLPEEFLGQAIKEVVMHEVGHSLGLRHNFKASTMLRPDQINDTSITRVKGMTGSVMDYNPINVAPKGQKQGDFASTTIGPYDYWAIAYAYTPVMGNEEAELKKIAARSPEPDLAFATDDDFSNNDPQVNTYDLTSDTLAYGKMRMAMAGEMIQDLDRKVVKDGDSWARLRGAFLACIQQFGNGAYPRGRTHRRPVRQPRLQGDREGPRPDHARRRRPPARGTQAAGRPDPQRQGVPVLARLAPQADHRVVAGRSLFSLRVGVPDLPGDPQHPGDRARPVPRFAACSSASRTRRCRAIPAATRSRSPRSSAP